MEEIMKLIWKVLLPYGDISFSTAGQKTKRTEVKCICSHRLLDWQAINQQAPSLLAAAIERWAAYSMEKKKILTSAISKSAKT